MNATDSLVQVMDTIKNVTSVTGDATSVKSYQWAYWLGGALALGVIALGYLKRRKSEQDLLKQKMKGEKVDFDGVIHSAFHSKELYDMLKVKCHPDRFSTQPELIRKATEIFALIVKNKYNYQALSELKVRAEKELFIHF